jgi:hypothetical protein
MPAFCGQKSQDCNGRESWNRSSSVPVPKFVSPCGTLWYELRNLKGRRDGIYFQLAFKSWLFNRFFYACRGLEAHKRIFRGVPEQTYYAFNRLPSLPRVLKLARACKII